MYYFWDSKLFFFVEYISKLLYINIRIEKECFAMLKTAIEMDKAAMILKLFGDKTRLTMMKILDSHDCCVCEFVEIFKVSQPSISQHLRKLRDVGLVKEERRGQWIFYSINKSNDYYPFVLQILDQLPSQDYKLKELEEQGTRITCC